MAIAANRSGFSYLLANKKTRKIVAPIIALGIFLVLWQIFTLLNSGGTLPGPLTVLRETWELILNPFFDNRATDKGLFWQILASLQRVALGYSLAAIVGIAIG